MFKSVPSDSGPSSDVFVILLGAAQDGGYPQFGCWCDNCSAAYENPTLSDTAVSLALIDAASKKWWLVDASPQLSQQWTRFAHQFKGMTLSGIILTHAHTGHYCGLHYFGKECHNVSRLPLYASNSMHNFLQQHEPWAVMYRNGNLAPIVIESDTVIQLSSNISILPMAVTHRADFTDTFAFTILGTTKRLFYCPDIDHWRDVSLSDLAKQHHVMLLDATFYSDEELPNRDMSTIPHPRVADTVGLLSQMEMKSLDCEVVLIHMNHSNVLWKREAGVVRDLARFNIVIGTQGMKWNI